MTKKEFKTCHKKFKNSCGFYIETLLNFKKSNERDNIIFLLNILKGDIDSLVKISQKDIKIYIALYFQFVEAFWKPDSIKIHLEEIRNKYIGEFKFEKLDEVLISIITEKKALKTINLTNQIVPRCLSFHLTDILFEIKKINTEPVEELNDKTHQEEELMQLILNGKKVIFFSFFLKNSIIFSFLWN